MRVPLPAISCVGVAMWMCIVADVVADLPGSRLGGEAGVCHGVGERCHQGKTSYCRSCCIRLEGPCKNC